MARLAVPVPAIVAAVLLVAFVEINPGSAYPRGNDKREGEYGDENISDYPLKGATHLNYPFHSELTIGNDYFIYRAVYIPILVKLNFP